MYALNQRGNSMKPFIVIAHADGEESIAKVVIADSESSATEKMTKFVAESNENKDIYIDGVDCVFSATVERFKDDSLSSGALFLVAGHVDGGSLIWGLVESASLDLAVENFESKLHNSSGDEVYIDIEVGLLDLYDNPILAAEEDQSSGSRIDMLSIEVEEDVFNSMKSSFDAFERPDINNEAIFDFSHLSDPEHEMLQAEIANKLGLDAGDVDGYICMYV
jgi:hypothetical protein